METSNQNKTNTLNLENSSVEVLWWRHVTGQRANEMKIRNRLKCMKPHVQLHHIPGGHTCGRTLKKITYFRSKVGSKYSLFTSLSVNACKCSKIYQPWVYSRLGRSNTLNVSWHTSLGEGYIICKMTVSHWALLSWDYRICGWFVIRRLGPTSTPKFSPIGAILGLQFLLFPHFLTLLLQSGGYHVTFKNFYKRYDIQTKNITSAID